jgi:hypothetical protein
MIRVFGWLRRIGLDDVALLAGLVLLWIGCAMIARPLPYLVIGSLAVAFWAVPILLSMRRRRP